MFRRCFFYWILLWLCCINFYPVYSIDNPHFYRANFFWGEPRFQERWLTTFDMYLGGGGTRKARNNKGHKVPLLNIFGLHNMQLLGQNVPLDPQNNLDKILIDLEQVPARDNFGKLLFNGEFNLIEAVFNGYQNLDKGFFFQGYLPIRRLAINNIQFIDQSPEDSLFPNRDTPAWINFLNNFTAILNRYDLAIKNVHEIGIGDFSLLFGWTTNYQEAKYIDFFDVNVKLGVLFPTAKKKKIGNPFSLPLGYNGFYGLPFKFDCSLGYWEWLTAGFHIGALFLFERQKILAMKTSLNQNGFITLTKGKADVDPGTIWDVCSYLKADHFLKGLSFLVGYCYTQKDTDCIHPCNTDIFNPIVVIHDQLFKSWNMHVMHWIIEYDFAKNHSDIGPRVSLFYNWIVGGKRIFDTSVVAADVGIDVSWCY